MNEKKFYRPLPPALTIKKSEIEGLGLFATMDIEKDAVLGITHVVDDRFEDGLIRTPLGGFFNHKEDSNCIIVKGEETYKLVTKRKIKKGEELTTTYTIYDPTSDDI